MSTSNDRFIDPITGDYVDADNGGYKLDDVVLNKLAFSFSIAKQSWEGDPELGHRFDELANATDTPENRRLLKVFALEAVQWIIDDGDLDSAEVTVESHSPGRVAFQVDAFKAGRKFRAGPFIREFGAA